MSKTFEDWWKTQNNPLFNEKVIAAKAYNAGYEAGRNAPLKTDSGHEVYTMEDAWQDGFKYGSMRKESPPAEGEFADEAAPHYGEAMATMRRDEQERRNAELRRILDTTEIAAPSQEFSRVTDSPCCEVDPHWPNIKMDVSAPSQEPDLETDFFYYTAEKCGADISMSHPQDGGTVWFNTPQFERFCRAIHSADHAVAGHRLALELECLLMDTKDMPINSKWWDSAMEALEAWHKQFPYDGPKLGD